MATFLFLLLFFRHAAMFYIVRWILSIYLSFFVYSTHTFSMMIVFIFLKIYETCCHLLSWGGEKIFIFQKIYPILLNSSLFEHFYWFEKNVFMTICSFHSIYSYYVRVVIWVECVWVYVCSMRMYVCWYLYICSILKPDYFFDKTAH